jgi:CHAD domain-containing protein
MEKNLLNNYVLESLESLEQNLTTYTKDKNPESLLHLRVDIKKIKAVFSFAEIIYKEKYDTKKLKLLFSRAGKIREMHINIHLLSTFPHPLEKLINHLRKKENILIEQFIKNGPRFEMLVKDFRKKTFFPELLPSKKIIIKYFKNEKKKANKILRKKDRECMHAYRKKIKRMMYIYNSLPQRMQKAIELNKTEINKIQKKLGNWHDTYSAINYLSHAQFPIKPSKHILKLKEKEERQFNTLLINMTNDLI